jgi:hypothetical protein
MYDRTAHDFDHEDTSEEHPQGCGCRDCDPDFYTDPAERDAGRRDF